MSYEVGDIEPFDLFRWFVGGSTPEKMEIEDGLQIDIFTGLDEMGRQTERDSEEQFKDMQTKISIYLNA